MARAPVNTDIGQPERVQTTARPMGISAPVATVAPSPLLALATSLRELRPELNGFIQEAQATYQTQEQERAYDTIQGMTYEQSKAAVESGEMRNTESPWFRAAFQKQFGMAHAANRKRQIVTEYNTTFDKENGNLDEFLAGYAQADYEQFGDSEFIKAGLREGMAGTFDTIRNSHAEYTSGQLQERAAQQFYSIAGGVVSDTVAQGGDVSAALGSIYGSHQETLGLTPEQMDAQALALAERFASEGDLASVEAVLNADPQGRGSFLDRSSYADKARGLRETAASNKGKSDRTTNTLGIVDIKTRASQGLLNETDGAQLEALQQGQQISQAERESLLEENGRATQRRVGDAFKTNLQSQALNETASFVLTGKGALVQDRDVVNPYTGDTITLSASELVDTVVNEQLDAMAAKGGELPNLTATMAQQLSSYAVPTKYSPWENTLSNGHVSLTNALRTAEAGGEASIPEPAQNAYRLWKEMAGTPQVRERHTTDPVAAGIYRDAETLERNGYMEADDALMAAARAAENRRDGRTSLALNLDRDKFNSQVASTIRGGGFLGVGGNGEVANAGYAGQEIERQARLLMDLNIPMDKAIKEAAERFQSSHTVISGVYVNTRDRFIPPNFDVIVDNHIKDYVTANPDAADDDLHLVPSSDQDYWYISDGLGVAVGSEPVHISRLQKSPTASNTQAEVNAEIAARPAQEAEAASYLSRRDR